MENLITPNHQLFMQEALEEAEKAAAKEEIPVGAVITYQGKIIARGHNIKESTKDPIAHAEILAIKQACSQLDNWRLTGCILYVTKEPCIMCSGAIVQARVETVVFGCRDLKAGGAQTLYQILSDPRLNHQVRVVDGVLEDKCRQQLSDFFINLRESRQGK